MKNVSKMKVGCGGSGGGGGGGGRVGTSWFFLPSVGVWGGSHALHAVDGHQRCPRPSTGPCFFG